MDNILSLLLTWSSNEQRCFLGLHQLIVQSFMLELDDVTERIESLAGLLGQDLHDELHAIGVPHHQGDLVLLLVAEDTALDELGHHLLGLEAVHQLLTVLLQDVLLQGFGHFCNRGISWC